MRAAVLPCWNPVKCSGVLCQARAHSQGLALPHMMPTAGFTCPPAAEGAVKLRARPGKLPTRASPMPTTASPNSSPRSPVSGFAVCTTKAYCAGTTCGHGIMSAQNSSVHRERQP